MEELITFHWLRLYHSGLAGLTMVSLFPSIKKEREKTLLTHTKPLAVYKRG